MPGIDKWNGLPNRKSDNVVTPIYDHDVKLGHDGMQTGNRPPSSSGPSMVL